MGAGALAIPPRFGLAEGFSEGFAVVSDTASSDGEYHYIDRRGRAAIPGKFVAASHFFKGLAHVKLKKAPGGYAYAGDFAYIGAKGERVFAYTVEEGD